MSGKKDFKLWVIGTSYCHSRMFQLMRQNIIGLKVFDVAKENVSPCTQKSF